MRLALFRPPVLLDLQRLQMRCTVGLHDEAVLNEEVHLPYPGNLHMPAHV